MKPILVIKIGTQAITPERGEIDVDFLQHLTEQISILSESYHILLVSSGAVGCGRNFIQNYSGKVSERKAAAAIGNPILIQHYQECFKTHNLADAQILIERDHFADRKKFLQLRETIQELWKHGIIPICNENDVVSDFEIRFSDNDELAALLAINFNAKKLLLGTSVEGLLDKDGSLVSVIEDFEVAQSYVRNETSAGGRGGMHSKLSVAQRAAELGVEVTIFQANRKNGIIDSIEQKIGTTCVPTFSTISAHQRWIGSGAKAVGKIFVDLGAKKALEAKNSLLLVGVKSHKGTFGEGDIVEIFVTEETEPFAVARTRINSTSEDFNTRPSGVILARPEEISFL